MKGTSFKYAKAAVAATLSFVAAGAAVLNYLVRYAIGRGGGGGTRKAALDVEKQKEQTGADIAKDKETYAQIRRQMDQNHERQKLMTEDFLRRTGEQQVSIVSDDKLILKAGYFKQEDSHQWAVILHGYRSRHNTMINFAQRYYDAGYHVLMPDLRACGESEGKYLGMGWLDRRDILGWISWILAADPDALIVLHGVSMGAATVMMAAGEETPDAVRVYVEDCGYTSAWAMFASELKLRFHLPKFPLLYLASGITRVRAGYGFKEASALNQVKKCEKPMLFIHGDRDDFVPFKMLRILYEAKPGNRKQKIEVKGAGHGEAAKTLGDDYWNAVFAFISQYTGERNGENI